jgi:hypothetical protein
MLLTQPISTLITYYLCINIFSPAYIPVSKLIKISAAKKKYNISKIIL